MIETISNDVTMKSKQLFSLLIDLYCLLCIAGFVYLYRVFGIGPACILSFMMTIPIVVGLRMGYKWHRVKNREFAFLLVLIVFVVSANAILLKDMYARHLDHYHQENLKADEFAYTISGDATFRYIKVIKGRKRTFTLQGIVETKDDIERLKLLASQSAIIWNADVKVRSDRTANWDSNHEADRNAVLPQ